MKVLFVASESVPFIKTGGLADVIGSLPKSLKEKGIDVRVILPLYKEIIEKYKDDLNYKFNKTVRLSWRNQYCGVFEIDYDGVIFYFVDNEYYFKRDGVYGYYDDAERFAFYSKAVLDIIPDLSFKPDILHCHDWHTGLVSVFLKSHYLHNDYYKDMKTVFTIHNLHYQGIFSKEILKDVLELGEEHMTLESLEYHGAINCMKGGIAYSDKLTTVSRTYAKEITYPYFGEGLDGILRKREYDLKGIINGIDYSIYDPSKDSYILHSYSLDDMEGKIKNKIKLQEELGLDIDKDVPIISIVSRLVDIKGMDLVMSVLEEIINTVDIQVVVLGTGDKYYEDFFKYLDYKYKNKVSANITFSNELAHKVYSASDLLLMPSRFEPCGLSQIIALKYGTIPVVRETGGLNDTVLSFNDVTFEGNGFTFKNFNAHDMMFTIKRAVDIYNDKDKWEHIVKNAMESDYSWDNSAQEYIELYKGLSK